MAQDAITIPTVFPPAVAPGKGMTSVVRHISLLVKSNPVLFSDTTSVNLIEFQGNELIQDIQVNVTSAFDASGSSAAATATITVPGATGALTVWDAGNTRLQIVNSDYLSPSTNPGWIQIPASGGFLKFLLTPGTALAGQAEVYLRYLADVSKLY